MPSCSITGFQEWQMYQMKKQIASFGFDVTCDEVARYGTDIVVSASKSVTGVTLCQLSWGNPVVHSEWIEDSYNLGLLQDPFKYLQFKSVLRHRRNLDQYGIYGLQFSGLKAIFILKDLRKKKLLQDVFFCGGGDFVSAVDESIEKTIDERKINMVFFDDQVFSDCRYQMFLKLVNTFGKNNTVSFMHYSYIVMSLVNDSDVLNVHDYDILNPRFGGLRKSFENKEINLMSENEHNLTNEEFVTLEENI